MDNVDSILTSLKTIKKVAGIKKNKAPANSFKRLYQIMMDSSVKRQKEAENKKRYRLSVIIQKLLAGILLTSDELQFLKQAAPVYYNEAMQQLRDHGKDEEGRRGTGEAGAIEPTCER